LFGEAPYNRYIRRYNQFIGYVNGEWSVKNGQTVYNKRYVKSKLYEYTMNV
jgi:hypothetical protein